MHHPKIVLGRLNAPDAGALCATAPTMSTTTGDGLPHIVLRHHIGIIQVVENADGLEILTPPEGKRECLIS